MSEIPPGHPEEDRAAARARQREGDIVEARRLTTDLRSSPHRRWREFRQALQEEGLVPVNVAVGELFPDDVNLMFGVLRSRDDRVFTFDFDFPQRLENPGFDPAEGRLRRFEEQSLEGNIYVEGAEIAQAVLDEDSEKPRPGCPS